MAGIDYATLLRETYEISPDKIIDFASQLDAAQQRYSTAAGTTSIHDEFRKVLKAISVCSMATDETSLLDRMAAAVESYVKWGIYTSTPGKFSGSKAPLSVAYNRINQCFLDLIEAIGATDAGADSYPDWL